MSLNGEVDPAYQDSIPRIGFIGNVLGNRRPGVDDTRKLRAFFTDDYERETVTMRVKMHDKISALREIGNTSGLAHRRSTTKCAS